MKEILEIIVAILACFGAYSLAYMAKTRLLYRKKTKKLIRAAVTYDDNIDFCEVISYVEYLRCEKIISDERLIILVNDDIIINEDAMPKNCEIIKNENCKE